MSANADVLSSQPPPGGQHFRLAIEATGMSKSFGAVDAVTDFNLQVPESRIYGFLGPNGSGKSTTIRMLCGLLTPTAGEISVLGHSIPAEAEALRRKVGYMTQKFSLYEDLTGMENLRFMANIYTMPRAVQKQRLAESVERYGLGKLLHQFAGTMSGGQKQRLALAAATLHRPQLLFLDEPTSAVDPENRRAFWEILFDLVEEGTTILVSTHYMDEAERCHALAILDHGRLAAEGSPQELTRTIDAQVAIIQAQQLHQVSKFLDGCDFVKSTAQIGNSLRVMVDKNLADVEQTLRQAAGRQNLILEECQLTSASLEDVFVAATQARKSAA